MFFPWFLIILGSFFLLENLGLLPQIGWNIFWPVLLIALGLVMLKRRLGDSCCGWTNWKKDSTNKENKNGEER